MVKEDKRTFTLAVLLSITTGILLTDSFGDMHEALEWFVGEPIGTIGTTVAAPMVAKRILRQHPQLAEIDASGTDRSNWLVRLNEWRAKYGDSFECTRGEYIPPPEAEKWPVLQG